jgi:titin
VFNTLDDLNPGSLRREILDANATTGPNTIVFSLSSGVQTIRPMSALPAITRAVTLDGTTQPGYGGSPLVVLDGSAAGNVNGLTLAAGGSTVRGLVISHFAQAGILVQSANNAIYGNYLGTNASGQVAAGNAIGVDIQGAANNSIGLAGANQGNLISGNTLYGVRIQGTAARGNTVQQNRIGTDRTGTAAVLNVLDGVALLSGAAGNVIGTGAAGNVISGNGIYGIFFNQAGSGNAVRGNLLGTNATGTAAVPNAQAGMLVSDSPGNTVGGTSSGQGNLISGNGVFGVVLTGAGSTGNVVAGNGIGVSASYASALPNVADGVQIYGAAGNTIGGTAAAAGNVIAGNGRFGVYLATSGTRNNQVVNNLIGVTRSGTAMANTYDGVALFPGANNNTIGGVAAGMGNVISGNGRFGVYLVGYGEPPPFGLPTTSGNLIQGNKIGTNAAGTAAVPNAVDGVALFTGADGNTIGGTASGARNIISGNRSSGIGIANASGTLIQGNYLGTDATGTAALANGVSGVQVVGAGNTITANVISGNGNYGVALVGTSATGNVVQGNKIGTNATGSARVRPTATTGDNAVAGVIAFGAPGNTIGGSTPASRNIVAGDGDGIVLGGMPGANSNVVMGNYVGTDVTGTQALGNPLANGVRLEGANFNIIGGTDPGAGNLISGNGLVGLLIEYSSGNAVQGNRIGTRADGSTTLTRTTTNNAYGGIVLNGGSAGNLIGGDAPGAGNVVAGNATGRAGSGSPLGLSIVNPFTTNNLVRGNFFGINAAGSTGLGGGAVSIANGASGNVIAANIISGNLDAYGVTITDQTTTGNLVQGNYIGTDLGGTYAVPNLGGVGIFAPGNTVGGTTPGAYNVISGNGGPSAPGVGIVLSGVNTTNNQVVSNLIGVQADGVSALADAAQGVLVTGGATNNTIGGIAPGAGNLIAYNGDDGVLVGSIPRWPQFATPAGTGNSILGNSIFGNGRVGIDLGPDDGVTPNDSAGHNGPNDMQNFPVINGVTLTNTGGLDVNVSLGSTAGHTFRLEFFANTAAYPGGVCQGQTFLGAVTVTTDGSGNFAGTVHLDTGMPPGEFVLSATATDLLTGDTSEFSGPYTMGA